MVRVEGGKRTKEGAAMIYVYRHDADGWRKVRKCRSFGEACRVAKALADETGVEHCVNGI